MSGHSSIHSSTGIRIIGSLFNLAHIGTMDPQVSASAMPVRSDVANSARKSVQACCFEVPPLHNYNIYLTWGTGSMKRALAMARQRPQTQGSSSTDGALFPRLANLCVCVCAVL